MSDYNDGLVPEPCLRLDYGFGQQYASVELGDGTGYVRVTDELRSEHHKMKRWYDDVLKDAMDSNDELRMRNASLEAALEGMHLIREQDKAENDKLRELADKAWKAAEMLCQAWDGPCHADGVSIKPPCPLDERDELCVYGLIQRDLRELGAEVDG